MLVPVLVRLACQYRLGITILWVDDVNAGTTEGSLPPAQYIPEMRVYTDEMFSVW